LVCIYIFPGISCSWNFLEIPGEFLEIPGDSWKFLAFSRKFQEFPGIVKIEKKRQEFPGNSRKKFL